MDTLFLFAFGLALWTIIAVQAKRNEPVRAIAVFLTIGALTFAWLFFIDSAVFSFSTIQGLLTSIGILAIILGLVWGPYLLRKSVKAGELTHKGHAFSKVLSSRNLSHVDLARSFLEGHGITCFLRNEYSAHTAAGGIGFAMNWGWPELWVKTSDLQEALALLGSWNDPEPSGPPGTGDQST